MPVDFTRWVTARMRRRNDDVLYQRLTFCGVTRWVEDWVRRAKIRKATVTDRIERQGMSPLAALTKPDANGNCLRPLTPEEYAADAREYRKDHTRLWQLGGGTLGYQPVIETSRGRLDLGTYPTQSEAAFALNLVMALTPDDWQPEDRYPLESPVPNSAASRIRQGVEELITDLFPELPIGPNAEVEFAREQ